MSRFAAALRFGATCDATGRTRFRLWAPAKAEAWVEVDGVGRTAMQATGDGWFEAQAQCGAGARYRYAFAGGLTVPDPASRAQDQGPHGWSVVVDPDAYDWRTGDWTGRPWEETVLYELHAGLCGGLAGVAQGLEALKALGVTAVQLMPIAEFSGARSWGYDGVLPYAPAAAYGAPEDLKRLVDYAHGLGLMIFLDVVYNHFGPDGNYLGAYAPTFFRDDVQTPWGGAVDVRRPEISDYFVQNAIYWLQEYRFDGLRLDAVHAIGDPYWVDDMGRRVREAVGEDRHVHLVLENEHNGARHLRGAFDAQWNDDFHNAMHVLLTGETHAYYEDFADRPADKLARCLAQGFAYQGEPSLSHGGEPRGEPSADLAPAAFVSFLQNHDQVGNRAMGERLIALADSDALTAAMALLLLCPQVPMLFMGEEVGARSPFLFFTDFHHALADAVREGRRREFAATPPFADPAQRARIPDPNLAATFERSRVQPGEDADAWRAFYTTLLSLRREHVVPRLRGAKAGGAEVLGDKAVVARWRMGDGATLTLALNLGEAPVPMTPPASSPLFGELAGDGVLSPRSLVAWLGRAS